ncbi:MAG: glycosyltransferase [bacterium]|nr:glycosyltransferase [bacterium]
MSEGFSKKKKELVKDIEVPSVVSLEGSSTEQTPVSELTRVELKEKLRAVIVNMDQLAEQAAHDSAERSLTASAESMKGVSGFFKKIWTHTLAREYYRQQHLSEAREKIHEDRNIHAAEFEHPAGKEAHEAMATTLVERFAQEYEETLHKGESRKVINRDGENGLNVKGEIISLMKDYAAGKVGDDDFNEAKKQILHSVSRIDGGRDDTMYADNLLEIARQVKQAVEHGEAVDALDLDLDVVLGNARDSIQTEVKHNVVDRAIEFAKKTPLGVLVNESTLASGIAIAAGITVGFSKRFASSRLAAIGTLGATAALSGGLIGYAENKRTKEDRSQHAREMAQGRTYEKGAVPRHEEMDKFIHEMRDASQLASAIREAKSDTDKLNAIADAEARIRLMDRENIDLLSYSDPTKVEQERFDLDMARAQAKAELRKSQNVDDVLIGLIDKRSGELTNGEGGIEERDRLFNKMKNKRVAAAAFKGVAIGLTVGTAAQEAAAFFNDEQTGLVEHLVKGGAADHGQVVHTTWMEGLRRFVGDQFGGGSGGGQSVTEHINTVVDARTYLENHKLGTHISRDGWYDNDTPKPVFDKNELKLWWGGDRNTGLDANGNYVFSAKHMVPEGSYHNGLSANAQELMREGKLKMLLSLSQGTQAHPVELPINADGTVTIDPNSEIGKLFFAEQGGKAQFLGRFAEVAELTGSKDGTEHMRILATHVGKGINELNDVITKETIAPPNDYLIDPPPFIPIYGRKPLEPVNGRKGPNPFIPLYYGSGEPLTPETLKAYREAFSPRLRSNPDVQLEAKIEEEEYLAKQDAEYRSKVEELVAQTESMNQECKIAVCIPVAGHQETNAIEQTLQAYLNQTAEKNTFELVLFVNQPDLSPQGEKIKSDGTLDKIEKFKKEHPELNIRVMQTVIPRSDVRIGNIRKMLSDATIVRSLKRGGNKDLIMVSNDADLKGVAPEYLDNFIEKLQKEPKTDAVMGQLDWDPEAYIRNPLNHVGTRLFQYIAVQHRKAKRGIESSGANFAYRASMYAAVGGYDSQKELGEDNNFGRKITAARSGTSRNPIEYGGARVSRLYTSSRRAEKAIQDGLSPIEQWQKGFSAFDDEVRKVKWEETGEAPDYDNPEVVKKLVSELENIINRTLMVSSNWWSQGPYSTYQRRALGWLGIKYELVGPNKIRITDSSDLISGLKEYKEEGLKIMERKIGKRLASQETPPKPTPPEPAPTGEADVVAEGKVEAGTPASEIKTETAKKEEAKAPVQESRGEGKENISIDKLKVILRAELEKDESVTAVGNVEINIGKDGLQLDIDIETKLGKATIKGLVANEGSRLVIRNLDVESGLLIKSRVREAFSKLGGKVQEYFAKQEGKPVSKIQITGEGLSIEFGNTPVAEVKAEAPKTAKVVTAKKDKPRLRIVNNEKNVKDKLHVAPAKQKRVRVQ